MQQQMLRASFQAMVVQHRPQHPQGARRRGRGQGGVMAAFTAAAATAPRRAVHTAAVRADAPTEAVDTATIKLISDMTAAVDARHAAALAAAKEAVGAEAPPPADAESARLRAKVRASILDLQSGLLERETEVGLLLEPADAALLPPAFSMDTCLSWVPKTAARAAAS